MAQSLVRAFIGGGLRGNSLASSSSSFRRHIVTVSIAPPLPAVGAPSVYMERPETIVLAEGSLLPRDAVGDAKCHEIRAPSSSSSWESSFASFFPKRGLHLACVDITTATPHPRTRVDDKGIGGEAQSREEDEAPSLRGLEANLARDLNQLGSSSSSEDPFAAMQGLLSSSPAHAVLVAWGPIPSLVAQYYLESSPLAGLVLVDPMLLPHTGVSNIGDEISTKQTTGGGVAAGDDSGGGINVEGVDEKYSLQSSAETLLSTLGIPLSSSSPSGSKPPTESELESELQQQRRRRLRIESDLVRSLAVPRLSDFNRPLLLEPGAVPVLVLYSAGGNDQDEDHRRICAERTAEFHVNDDAEVVVRRIPSIGAAAGGNINAVNGNDNKEQELRNMEEAMECIYEWYDEVVA